MIGLGRAWEARYRPALAGLRDRLEVVAVYDEVARRAEIVAGQARARAAGGLADLIEDPEVDAVALLAPQWFGAHPVELAARAGKPIYVAVPLPDDPGGATRPGAQEPDRRPTLLVEPAADPPPDAEAWLARFHRLVREGGPPGSARDDAPAAANAGAAPGPAGGTAGGPGA